MSLAAERWSERGDDSLPTAIIVRTVPPRSACARETAASTVYFDRMGVLKPRPIEKDVKSAGSKRRPRPLPCYLGVEQERRARQWPSSSPLEGEPAELHTYAGVSEVDDQHQFVHCLPLLVRQ